MKQARQPVFKPLSNTENTSLFTFESSCSRQPPAQFMRTHENQTNTNAPQKAAQQQDGGTERLSSLHAKLHQEADKIRKWKVQTEIELKQKEKKIVEASTTNESLRKSILELQLQNENLSLKLQEEMGNREDIVERINSTRQLCSILKDHALKLEEKLHQCETERTELKYLEKEHSQQFEELSSEFSKLEISSVEDHNRLVSQLNEEREDRRKLEEELVSKLNEAEIQLKTLMDQCDDKDIEIRDVRTMLQRNDEKIHTLEQNIGNYQEKVEMQATTLNENEKRLKTSAEKMQCLEVEKLKLEDGIKTISSEVKSLTLEKLSLENSIVSSKAEHGSKIENLQQQVTELSCRLQAELERVGHYEGQVNELSVLSENLKSNKDFLTLEKTQLEADVNALKQDVGSLHARIEELQNMNLCLKEDNLKISKDLQDSRNQMSQLQKFCDEAVEKCKQTEEQNVNLREKIDSLENTVQQKEDECILAVNQTSLVEGELKTMKTEITKLQNLLQEEREKVEDTMKSLDDSMAQMTLKSETLSTKETDIKKLRKEYEKCTKNLSTATEENHCLKEKIMELEAEKDQYKHNLGELQGLVENLKEDNEQQKSINFELESKSKHIMTLESKHKELKSDITTKNKQIRELEKELKGLKSKLACQVKAVDVKNKECESMSDDINKLNEDNEDLKLAIASLKKELKDANSSAKLAAKQMEDMKTKQAEAMNEKKETEQHCEFQLAEMMATMEKYKQENNKIVQQKEKELEALKSKSNQSSTLKEKESQLKELQSLNEELKASLEQETLLKSNLALQISGKVNELESLEMEIKKKETQIEGLKQELHSKECEIKKKKKIASTCTQTSLPSSPVQNEICGSRSAMQTPKIQVTDDAEHTSQNGLKTPQRSILKNTNSVSKRRKVVFASHDDSGRHSASDSDSSSELMEVEMQSVENRYKTSGNTTPLVIRPSPKLRPSPKTPEIKRANCQKTPLVRVPRGPAVKLKDKKQGSKSEYIVTKERDKFRELFPDCDLGGDKENRLMQKDEQDMPHVRKAATKTTPKFFKGSLKDRYSKKTKTTTKEDIAWFDLDSVFGFED